MPFIHSFAPIADSRARLLILGSMPGQASLKADQYYAHPRNAFWPLMGNLLGFDPSCCYQHRQTALIEAGIAVWDVLASCIRVGSLDAAIQRKSQTVNDFSAFFACHPGISAVFFNGGAAAKCFEKRVAPHLTLSGVHLQQLPSTSPANATRSFEQKLTAWRAVVQNLK